MTGAPNRTPVVDPKTGRVTSEWLNYFANMDAGGGLSSFTNVSITRVSEGSGQQTLTVDLDANDLIGDTLAAGVVNSSLMSVGNLTGGSAGGGFTVQLDAVTLTGSLPWSNMPAGEGTWTARPIIIGLLTVHGGLTVLDDIYPEISYRSDLGHVNSKFRILNCAELAVETLVAQDIMATIGGRIIVAPTTSLTADLAPAATSITVKHNNLANGDRVRLEGGGNVEWMAITSGASGTAGLYVYSVTRNLDGSGANQWYLGDAVLDTGTTGKGLIDIYSTAGIFAGTGPSIVGNVRTGTTYSQIAARWAIGNLNGVYGYVTDTYGAAFGDNTASWLKIDPSNGVRIGYDATTHATLSSSGLEFGAGGVILSSTGLYINPVSASGGGTFANTNAVRWSTSTTYRTAIWRSDDVSGSAIKEWNFDHINDPATTIWTRTINTTRNAGAGSAFGMVYRRDWAKASNTDAEHLTFVTGDNGITAPRYAFLWMWAKGAATVDRSVVLGVGVPITTGSGGPPGYVSLDGGLTISTSFVSVTGDFAASGTFTERGRSVAMGVWTAVAFSAGHYTASGSMTWTLTSPDQVAKSYMLVGTTMWFNVWVELTTTGGTASFELRIALPGGFTCARNQSMPCLLQTATGVIDIGMVQSVAGNTYVQVRKKDQSNFGLVTDQVNVQFIFPFEVS